MARRRALHLATVATPVAPKRGTTITLSVPAETNLAGALCTEVKPEVFFPEGNESEATEQVAKRICAVCPVRMTCLTGAIARDERFGVFGGLTTAERDMLIGRVGGCGTRNGYWRHRFDGSRPCRPCLAARTEQDRKHRNNVRAARSAVA